MKTFNDHLVKHGDGVREIALRIDDVQKAYEVVIKRGAKSIKAPTKVEDKNGKGYVWYCTIHAYSDTLITLVDRSNFTGTFWPNFKDCPEDPFSQLIETPEMSHIDHIVSNHGEGEMEIACDWYEKILDFHRFWSVDDSVIHTEYSSLKSIVMADYDETIKMPQNEPAKGKKGKSQIQEYVDYYMGAGVQHIAINCKDVISVVKNLRRRGLKFLNVPKSYYDNLRKRLSKSSIQVKEDLNIIEDLGILVDFDDKGYLLQLFTKNMEDRPTLFIEFIQRANNDGFGVGNFKSLFEAIERDQKERGNL